MTTQDVLVGCILRFFTRMEAALAEMALDDANKDLEDDIDFVDDKGTRYELSLLLRLSDILWWWLR
jgi:hypothetical protein